MDAVSVWGSWGGAGWGRLLVGAGPASPRGIQGKTHLKEEWWPSCPTFGRTLWLWTPVVAGSVLGRGGSLDLPLLRMRKLRPGGRSPWSLSLDSGSEQDRTLVVLTLGLVLSCAGKPAWGAESSGRQGSSPPQLLASFSSFGGGEPLLSAPVGGRGHLQPFPAWVSPRLSSLLP